MIAVSFLGTGNYQKCKYSLNDLLIETEYFAHALCEAYKPDLLYLVLTKEAKEKHGHELEKLCSFEEIIIPFGESENEIWEIFDLLSKKIPSNEDVILDITHGFRSQPLLAVSIILFLRTLKNISLKNIFYGAFEAKDGNNVVPVFDLKPFINIIDWSFAVDQFVKNGNARNLRNIIQEIHTTTHLSKFSHKSQSLHKFGKTLDDITSALSVIRPEEVCRISKLLPELIDSVQIDISNIPQVRPLGALLEKIPDAFARFASAKDNLFTKEGFIAQSEMIKFYLQIEKFQQAVTLARETIVSKLCASQNLQPTKKEDRETVETQLNDFASSYKYRRSLSKENSLYGELWHQITQIRNDVNHAGMRKGAQPTASLIKNIKKVSSKTIALLNVN
jgi:CRISPR-associated DxTHG motif protein